MSSVSNGTLVDQLKALGINEKTAKYALSVSVGIQCFIAVLTAVVQPSCGSRGQVGGSDELTRARRTTTM